MSTIKELFEITNADGIDFIPIDDTLNEFPKKIYESFTKEEFFQTNWYPKSCYRFWKIINGQKKYIDL